MDRYCQNPLCENEASKVVPISVDRPSDQKGALCAVCEEAYSWGVQHGRITSMPRRVWVLHVTERESVSHARIFRSKRKAMKDLAKYLRAQADYHGPADLPSICDWMAEQGDSLGVDIFPAPVDLR